MTRALNQSRAFLRLCGVAVLSLTILVVGACSHKPATVSVPPPPPAEQKTPSDTQPEVSAEGKLPAEILEVPPDAKPLLVETGIASWYGAPYHNRRGSNGEIYNMHAMTAAHRTLPLGSIVRVTNPANGASVMVRITDRGPFIAGRIIDLSQAAAKQIGLIQRGTATVRVEVFKAPAPIEGGGKWAVQIGGFEQEQVARDLASHLSRRYHTAKVLTFDSPAGDWWVRVRVKNDLRARAEEVLRDTKTNEGGIFLVRLD
jgi:rare lipoprotein A